MAALAAAWSIEDIRNLVQRKFEKRPCWVQVKIALALYAGKDVIGCATAVLLIGILGGFR